MMETLELIEAVRGLGAAAAWFELKLKKSSDQRADSPTSETALPVTRSQQPRSTASGASHLPRPDLAAEPLTDIPCLKRLLASSPHVQETPAKRKRMAVRNILLLGNPLLSQSSEPVRESELPAVKAIGQDLHDTLMAFRGRHGWGRAIAAPQIGVLQRIVYLHVERPWLIINPVMTGLSVDIMELWDDCMSFPDLLVRVKRHTGFTLTYRDEQWVEQTLAIEGTLSELLQHEIDHLDGVLAVSRAADGAAFALRSQRHLLAGAAFANA